MKRPWTLTALVFVFTAGPVASQVPEGYILADSMPLLPLTANETYEQGRLSVEIDRSVAPDELEYVILAERILPRPELIEADAAEFVADRGPNWARRFEEARARPGLRWWWRTFDEVPIPWAVTGLAAHELAEKVREFAREPLSFFSEDTRIRFRYTATVEVSEDGTRSVTLTALWDMRCGMLCGLIFQHARVVTFDSDGNVLSISGDQRPNYIVS